jgi:predicted metal-dependent hydrolase
MSISNYLITVSDIEVNIVRKDIKNLHLGVYPPDGHVRVAVPTHINDDNVRLAVVSKLSWIRKQQKKFTSQKRQSEREMVTGECQYYFGRSYRLEVIERQGRHEVVIKNSSKLQLFINSGTTRENRKRVLDEWYRTELKKRIPKLLSKWQPVIGKQVTSWGVKKMKTKWGSCNIKAQRIWLNLELAKKPMACLEYVLVHELVHLWEHHHNEQFIDLMNKFMPQWKLHKEVLNNSPLTKEEWNY